MKKILISALLPLLAACGHKNENPGKPTHQNPVNVLELTAEQIKNAGITTGNPQMKTMHTRLKVNGRIDVPPQNAVTISAPLGGYLTSTDLLPGVHVFKGQKIAVMEDPQYITLQQDYLNTQVKLSLAETEYKRQEELKKADATSDKIYQQARADFQNLKIQLKALSEKLRLIHVNPDKLDASGLSRSINLYSPIDGYVSAVNVNIGKYVNPSDILFELVNPSDIHLALAVFEKDLDKLFIGQKVVATTINSTKQYSGEIILIGKKLSADRSVEVHCHFDNYDKSLIPGMFMTAMVETGNNMAATVPQDAVVFFEGKHYLFVPKEQQHFEMIEVEVLETTDGFSQVKGVEAELTEKTPVVTAGAYTLLMKLKNTEEE